MKTENRVLSAIGLAVSCALGYVFPPASLSIFMDISGHSKGWGYDLGSEKGVSIMSGVVELIIALIVYLFVLVTMTKRLERTRNSYKLLPFAAMLVGFFIFFLTSDLTIEKWLSEFSPPQ